MDVTPAPINLDPTFTVTPYTNTPLVLAGYEPSDDATSEIDVRWRVIGNPTWTTQTFLTGGGGAPYLFGPIIDAPIAAGDYEMQVRGIKPGTTGPWSASLPFSVLAQPAVAFPFVDVADQWGDPSGYTLSADDLNARLVDRVNALADAIVGWASRDARDITRAGASGMLARYSADSSIAADASLAWDTVSAHAFGYRGWWPLANGGDTVWRPVVPGRYRICARVQRTAPPPSPIDVTLEGLPSGYGTPTASITTAGVPAEIDGCFQLDGTERIWLTVDTAMTVDASQSRFSAWRIGL